MAWKMPKQMRKNNVVQTVKAFLIKKTKDAAIIFPICVEHRCKTKNRDLGFRNARQVLNVFRQLLII